MSNYNSARLVQAIRKGLQGGGHVWMPQITTRHLRRNEALADKVLDSKWQRKVLILSTDWLIWYRPTKMPDPEWTETLDGAVAHAYDGDTFTIVDEDASQLYYSWASADLDNAEGTILEARVRIPVSAEETYNGAAIAIYDGTYQFVVHLRHNGFNIDGQAHCAIDFTTTRRVKLIARGAGCEVFIDGDLRQRGGYTAETTLKQVLFGSDYERVI
jgi:hypothetical protein